jgi:hypothetical protein
MSGPSPSVSAPVFVLAPPRSYTSVFAACLGQHPELYGLPELNLFQARAGADFWSGEETDGSPRSPFWATMRHGMLRTVAQLYAGEQTLESIQMAERWIRQRAALTTGEIYQELAARIAPQRIVEKSPGYLRRREFLDRLIAAFPEARFIHLLRHPLAQGRSALNARGGPQTLFLIASIDYSGDQPLLDPQILWHDAQVQILEFLGTLPGDRSLRVRGEDFMSDPDATMTRICEWLGIATTTEALEAMRHPERSPYSCEGPPTARLGNDINFLHSPGLRPGKVELPPLDGSLPWRPDGAGFHPRVVALAEELGYGPAGAGAPAAAPRRFLGPELWKGPGRVDVTRIDLRVAMEDPQLRALGEQLRQDMLALGPARGPAEKSSGQHSPAAGTVTPELGELRDRLHFRAELLETLLEETLNELEGVERALSGVGRETAA